MAIRSRSATSFSIRMPKNSSGPACARPSPWSPCAENSIGIWSGFLRDAYNELQLQAPCYVWYGWQSAVAMLGMGELRVLVKRAFDRGFIELHLLGFGDFEEDLKHGIERPGEPLRPGGNEYALFGDTIEELSGWYCFTEKYRADRER